MQSMSSGPLVFWRDTAEGRRGLACHVQFCDNPECSCQEAQIQAYEVDEHFHSLVSRGHTVEVRSLRGEKPPPRLRKGHVVVDLETGSFLRHRDEGGPSELREWLRSALDDEAVSDLRTRWNRFKSELKREREALSKRTWRERDWSTWNGEDPIAWADVLGDGARDRYQYGDRIYEARDLYCVRPGCGCGSITIRFSEESGEPIGEVMLDEATGEVVGTDNRPGAHRTLLDLFDGYEARNDLASFARRAGEMTRIGPEIHALRRRKLEGPPGAKIGRNAPCPCGSGKKYKNCCSA